MTQATRQSRFTTRQHLLAAAIATCFVVEAQALPVAPTVVSGSAGFATAGNTLTVTNSASAIINWQKFGIAAGETTRFIQPSASSTVLNQVVGNGSGALEMSKIYGTLSSNGKVWLVNPAGIMVGPGGMVDTAGFVASTLKIKPEDFLAGRLNFQATAGAGDVINQGAIKTPLGGSVYLVGTNVSNEGIITTPNGETLLAAGATVNLIDTATPGVKVEITGAANNATNLGTIVAEAGRIGIAGSIVRNSGTLNASSVTSDGGRIFLKASQDTYVDGSGRIVATGTKGGQVEVLGNRVAVMDDASIDVSGANGGGTILVGGDFQGKNPAVQNSQITYFGQNTSLKANATDNGDGGKVIVWADDTTRAYGSIEARGGANGGNGGFVETSGKQHLDFAATVDTRAAQGTVGTLLLDPTDITINATGSPMYASFTGGVFSGASFYGSDSIGWDVINSALSSSNVIIQTSSAATAPNSGSITVAAATYPTPLGGIYSLSLLAENNITLNSGSTIYHAGTGNLTLVSGWDSASGYTNPTATHATNTGNMTLNAGANIVTDYAGSGSITLKAKGALSITDAVVLAAGTMNVEAQSISILAATGNNGIGALTGDYQYNYYSGLLSRGDQTVSLGAGAANGSLSLISQIGEATVGTQGNQSITFKGSGTNTLTLQGSNTNTTYGGNSAKIEAEGNQSISYTSGSLAISIYGGAGVAANKGYSTEYYGGPIICYSCGDFNEAEIKGHGNQTINASSIEIVGGSGGNGNWAGIETTGTATYNVSGAINITGGASGGMFFDSLTTGLTDSVSNDGGLGADGGLTLSAGSITLNGGSATVGGAYIGSESNVSVTTTGNVSITGGTTNSGDWDNPATPAFIGSKMGSVTLNVGGSLTMAGGTGSVAGIGTINSANPTNITVGSNMTLSTSANSAPVGIGYIPLEGYYTNYGYYTTNPGDIGISPTATVNVNGTATINAWGSIGMYGTLTTPGTATLYAGYAHAGMYYLDVGGLLSANTINLTSTGPIFALTQSSGTINATIPSISTGTYSDIEIFNIGSPTTVRLVNNHAAATDSWMWLYNVGDLTLGSSSQFTSVSGGDLGIFASGLLSLNNLSLQRTASPAGYGEIILGGGTGINLSGTTVKTTATGAMTSEAYTYTDASGTTVTESYGWNYNGITLYSGGNITLAQGSKIEAPNADVLIELWGADPYLYVGKAGDASPSYVLAKATTTYIDFITPPTSGGVFINDVASLITTVGSSGFFAGNLSTPATEGAGLVVSGLGGGIIPPTTNEIVSEMNDLTTLLIPLTVDPVLQTTKEEQTTGEGDGEFGDDGKGKGKKKASQCKG